MKYITLIQDNWLVIVLIITAIIAVLNAIAHFRVRWAKTTPDQADDAEAKVFAKRIGVIIAFFKDLFLPGRKKKNDGGFVDINLLIPGIVLIVGITCGAFLNQKFRDPEVVPVPTPEYIEVHHAEVKESGEKKGSKASIKKFDCANGLLSEEISIEDYLASYQKASVEDSAKKVEALEVQKLDILLGAGGLIQTGDKLRDIQSFKPQLAGGLAYDKYAGFVASDFDKYHNAYALRRWSW